MCYSFNTSILSYSLGMISAIIAFFIEEYTLGMLILFYTQMQLSEAMIWKGIDTNNLELNKTGTTYGKFLLPTHIIAIGLGIILTVLAVSKRKLVLKDWVPLIVGTLFFAFVYFAYYRKANYPELTYPANRSCSDRTCQNAENRLRWPYPHEWYIISYVISLIILILYVGSVKVKIFLAAIFTVLFIASILIFPKTVGSVWCFSTAIMAPIIVIGTWLVR